MFDSSVAKYINIPKVTYILHENKLHCLSEITSKNFYNILMQKKWNRSHIESIWLIEFRLEKHRKTWTNIYCRKKLEFSNYKDCRVQTQNNTQCFIYKENY